MNITAFLIGLSLLAGMSSYGPAKSDREIDGLRGAVYAVRESSKWTPTRSARKIPHLPSPPPALPEGHSTTYYDRNGARMLRLTYEGGRVISKTTFTRESPGTVIEKEESGGLEIGSSGERVGPGPARRTKHVYRYTDDGAMAEQTNYSDDGRLVRQREYAYDRQGRIREEVEQPVLTFSHKTTTTFAYSEGQADPVSYKDTPGSGGSYTYEYDKAGNWVKQRLDEPYRIAEVTRTITYYSADGGDGVLIPGESPEDPLQPRFTEVPSVIRKSGGVLQESALHRVAPSYPPGARQLQGEVRVEIRIDIHGNVVSAKALSGPSQLQQAAIDAVKQWKFPETRLTGTPVEVIGIITFNFRN